MGWRNENAKVSLSDIFSFSSFCSLFTFTPLANRTFIPLLFFSPHQLCIFMTARHRLPCLQIWYPRREEDGKRNNATRDEDESLHNQARPSPKKISHLELVCLYQKK